MAAAAAAAPEVLMQHEQGTRQHLVNLQRMHASGMRAAADTAVAQVEICTAALQRHTLDISTAVLQCHTLDRARDRISHRATGCQQRHWRVAHMGVC